uniref:Putative secreted peptide n=1 Tax=Anopheles braziliensis TaxID=58242 RepID=A0A2M3ZUE0_9DIPT
MYVCVCCVPSFLFPFSLTHTGVLVHTAQNNRILLVSILPPLVAFPWNACSNGTDLQPSAHSLTSHNHSLPLTPRNPSNERR